MRISSPQNVPFDDGILVVGRNKCFWLNHIVGLNVEWSENKDVASLKVDNSSIMLPSKEKEKEWRNALVRLRELELYV